MFVGIIRKGHGPTNLGEGNFGQPGSNGFGDYVPHTTDWKGRWRTRQNAANDYDIDREAQRTSSYSGIWGIHVQDLAVTESMGPITDRSWEHLVTSDEMVSRTRRALLRAAQTYAKDGTKPISAENPSVYASVRGGNFLVPDGTDWLDAYADQLAIPIDTNYAEAAE